MLEVHPLADYLPDPNQPAIPDHLSRNLFLRSQMDSSHSALTVGNAQTQLATEVIRIRSVQVGAVTGAVKTVQVQVDGRDIFLDAYRPTSGGAPSEPSDLYVFPAGTPITTVIEAETAAGSGTMNVTIETEPFVLVSPSKPLKLKGKNRLSPSGRRNVAMVNAGVTPSAEQIQVAQSVSTAGVVQRQVVIATGNTGALAPSDNPGGGGIIREPPGPGGGPGNGGPGGRPR